MLYILSKAVSLSSFNDSNLLVFLVFLFEILFELFVFLLRFFGYDSTFVFAPILLDDFGSIADDGDGDIN